MDTHNQYLVFFMDEHRYALLLSSVERVVFMVEITPLPKAPEIVQGMVNVHGRIVPVVNIRRRFRLPEREAELSDQLIVAQASERTVAFAVDEVSDIVKRQKKDVIAPDDIVPGLEYVEGVSKSEDGIILIHDLGSFLSLEEKSALDQALSKTAGGGK